MTRAKNPGRAKLRKAPSAPAEGLEVVPYQLRLDAELHRDLKTAADNAGISLNQLIQGICRGAMANLVQGEARVSGGGFVGAKPQRGCVFFGRPGIVPVGSDEACEEYFEAHGRYPEEVDTGMVWFGLDFTNRGLVQYPAQ